MSNNVLVTGGLGYVGGRIATALAADPRYQVRVGTRRPQSPLPLSYSEVERVFLDVDDYESCVAACKGVDAVIHLAALDAAQCRANSEVAVKINTLGTIKMLKAAEYVGAGRFIYFSTAHIYGPSFSGTITEGTLPRSTHPYASSHRAAEDFVFDANFRRALTGIVVRLSNCFGVPAHPEIGQWMLVWNDLCRQAATRQRLVLQTPGFETRDFIALSDVSRAAMHLLCLPASVCGDGLFNLGGESTMRIIDVALLVSERCRAVLGYTPPIERPYSAPKEAIDPYVYCIDRLRSTGFALAGGMNDEVDDTLRLCQRVFV